MSEPTKIQATVSGYVIRKYKITECAGCGCQQIINEHHSPSWLCPTCQAEAESEYLEKCRLERMSNLEMSGVIGAGFARCRYEASNHEIERENQGMFKIAKSFLFNKNVFLHGDVGCGKTWLARCILNDAYDRGMSIQEVSGVDIAREGQKFTFQGPQQWSKSKVLLIDDIDKGPWKDQSFSALLHLLDQRRNAQKPTIVTCNFNPEGYREWLISNNFANNSTAVAIDDRMNPRIVLKMRTKDGRSFRHRETDFAGHKAFAR